MPSLTKFRLGLIINPYAGIGGALALKGSDGEQIRAQALAAGAPKQANDKASRALQQLLNWQTQLEIYTVEGEMGAYLASSMGFDCQTVYSPKALQTEAEDTQSALSVLLNQQLDLLLFAGGDGTARDIFDVLDNNHKTESLPVLGIPAGCKIHSGVYAVTPAAAGRVAAMLVSGQLASVAMQEVRDIDEQASRLNRVSAKYYGELLVPSQLQYVQAVKSAGKESEPLVLDDIASWLIEQMQDEPETLFVMGAGSTVAHIMQQAQLDFSLLGVDLVKGMQLLAKDVSEAALLRTMSNQPCKLVVTLIGNQGHVFGRGNQQLSAQVLRQIGRENILVVATKSKLQGLQERPLITDTQDAALDRQLAGLLPVITGYKDRVLCPLVQLSEQASFCERMSAEQISQTAQAYFEQIVEHGSDEELFASGYLSGHFDLVLSRFSLAQPVDLSELDSAIQHSFSNAFTQGELQQGEQAQVQASWHLLLTLLKHN